MARRDASSEKDKPETGNVQSILAKSARGASFLISLQIGSRALTFIVNQILVRFLSPELLGISSQLELFSVTVLTFARESIRVALGRSGDLGQEDGKTEKSKTAESYGQARKVQEAINLSYIAILLGPFIATFFSWLYWRNPEPAVLAMPCIKEAFAVYAAATILELCMEPCFAVAAQQMLFSTRATAEAGATFTRCIVNCGLAAWASRTGLGLGALPFAAGQLSYALVLNLAYYSHTYPRASREGYSLGLSSMQSSSSTLVASRLPRRSLNLALNLYAQSGLKHILTQGDSLLIAMFTSLRSQGIYALASNYGSLLARMLFQPIEESSRGVFSSLCSQIPPVSSSSTNSTSPRTTRNSKKSSSSAAEPHPNLLTAHRYLVTVLRLYSLLSTLLFFVAPTFLPPLLPLLAGFRFGASSGAPRVLGLYAYYLPLLAFNGLLEAFVAAVASPEQLRTQAVAMMTLSAGFAALGWGVLGWADGGAEGLVGVNGVNMGVRIIWSYSFVRRWFQMRGVELSSTQFLPKVLVVILGVAAAVGLNLTSEGPDGGFLELLKVVGVGGTYGLIMLYLERGFLIDCYGLLKPAAVCPQLTSHPSYSTI